MPPEPGSPARTTVVADAPIDWRRLAAAFADDTAGVQWYLDRRTGEVVRGAGDEDSPAEMAAERFIAIERVRSKEQYRWMERFITALSDRELAMKLSRAIAGKTAFQRFKVVLAEYPGRSNEWLSFRVEQIWSHIRLWLHANDLHAVEPPQNLRANWKHLGTEPAPPLAGRRAELDAGLAELEVDELEHLTALAAFLRNGGDAGGGEHQRPE